MEARIDAAKRVAFAFKHLPGVLGASACGSVGLGLADEQADLDLSFVVASTIPTRREKQRIYARLCGPNKEFETDVYAVQCQANITEHLVQVAFALNRTYCPGDKWSLHFIDAFRRVPVGLKRNLREFVTGANDAEGLVRKSELARVLYRDLGHLVKAEWVDEG